MRGLVFMVAWLCATLAATVTFAADLTRFQVEQITFDEMFAGKCTHSLVGEIVAGDADKLRREIESLPMQMQDDRNWVLCLDSPGGNLGEALQLGALITGPANGGEFFSTYVPEGASCLSACAVLFMHGVSAWHNYVSNFRMMHPTAVIGFHAPRLVLAGDNETQVPLARVTEAYATAMRHTAELAKRGSQTAWDSKVPIIPLTLLAQMLGHEGEDLFYVTLLHHAFLWDIRIQGQDSAIPPDFDLARGYMQICENALYGEIGEPEVDQVPEAAKWACDDESYLEWAIEGGAVPSGCAPVRPSGQPQIPEGHLVLTNGQMDDQRCGIGSSDGEAFEVGRYEYDRLLFNKFLPAIYLLPPATPIAALKY